MVEHPNLPFRREYTLLAQTPMIHFQHDQSGAALRPSEVKPKLDCYLRRICGGKIPKSWLISDQTQALNYQMRVLASGKDKTGALSIDQCRAYFGNMKGAAPKGLVFRDCVLEINCFVPELLNLIDQQIGSFFVLHNFGTRQSKGFGSFLVKENGYSSESFVRGTVKAHCHHYFTFSAKGSDTLTKLNHTYAVYSILKSGVNMSRSDPLRYIKGYSLRKFLPNSVGSDKAFIKSRVWPSSILQPKESDNIYPSYVFIRAILGLAESYEFRDDVRNGGTKTVTDKRTGAPKEQLLGQKVRIAHFSGTQVVGDKQLQIPLDSIQNKKGIQRFRSPFLIKVAGDRVYFILDDSWKPMLGQTFVITQKKKLDDILKLPAPKAQAELEQLPFIGTPDTFDEAAFISGFVDYFNSESVNKALRAFPDRGTGPRPRAGYEFREAAALVLEKGECL